MARGLSFTIPALAALLALGWFTTWEPRSPLSAVAPIPAREAAEDEAHAATESMRRSIESPIESERPVAATPEDPMPTSEARGERISLASGELRGFSSSSLWNLEALEAQLTAEISVSTVDELRWRFEHGLGELAGTGDDFDIGKAWKHDRIMNMVSPGDGTHWCVSLPREEFPEAYALWDRREAVRAELELRRRRGERWRPLEAERNPNEPAGE